MAKYRITAPDGNSYDVTAPDSATQDQVLAYAKMNYKGASPQGPDWKGVVTQAAKEATMRPGTNMRSLMTDPVTQAKALPALAGTVGGLSPLPGVATLGTVVGRQLSNLALRAYGKPEEIPSTGSQIAEGGLAALGDVIAIPKLKSAYYGSKIGQAESKFPGMANVVKEAPPSSPRTAVKLAQQLEGKDLSPLDAKRYQPAIDTIYKKGYPFQSAYKMYSPDFQKASAAVSSGLNKIPGRAAPAAAMAQANKIPNFIRDNIQVAWQNPLVRRAIYAALTGLGIGEGAKLTFGK